MVELLLAKGAAVNAADGDGDTALHLAIECGCLEAVRALAEAGAPLTAKNKEGLDPIDVAKYNWKRVEMARLLWRAVHPNTAATRGERAAKRARR